MNSKYGPILSPHAVAALPSTGFFGINVLVIGDVMLDRYIMGDVARISPEAPVPVLAVRDERLVAGGAANVALNVAGLRANSFVAGVVGDDLSGLRLRDILAKSGVDTSAVITDSSRRTTCKSRVICGNHQIVRFDEEELTALSGAAERELFETAMSLLNKIDAVILSDYAKGVLSVPLTTSLIRECVARRILLFVDPKRTDYTPYAGASCITPNKKEFSSAIGAMSIPGDDLTAAGRILRHRLDCEALLVTQGVDGMTLITGDHSHHLPALAQEVFDVSGAGDTVIATLATARAAGLDLLSSMQLSNAAASIVVQHAGTAPIRWDDLYRLVTSEPHKTDGPSLPAGSAPYSHAASTV